MAMSKDGIAIAGGGMFGLYSARALHKELHSIVVLDKDEGIPSAWSAETS